MDKKYYIMDSYYMDVKDDYIVKKLNLQKNFISKNGKWKPDFVGFIFTENETIISFPKHYCDSNYKIKDEDMTLLGKLMMKMISSTKLTNEDGTYENFPLNSYLYICNYYKKYGLYSETRNKKEKSYKGRIDWRNTIKKSNKVISGNNLVFLPFIVEKNIYLEVLITECMIYALEEGFNRFGKFFDAGININKKTNNPIFRNKDIVIRKLNLLRAEYFKDGERLLLDHLIKYFKWSNTSKNRTILVTKNFESYWESMVQDYISSNLFDVKSSGELVFKNDCNKYNFKKHIEPIESIKVIESGLSRNFSVEYDHLYISLNKVAYLFDSKYYKQIQNLDYKQMAYYFILKSSRNYINKEIINGLILPTEEEYYYRIHLDTRDRKGLLEDLFIVEHYLNVKKVIESLLEV